MSYEWLDLGFFGWHKLNVHSMRLEVWRHFDLVHVACDHRSNGHEGLKRFAIGICGPRRVHDHTVPSLEPPPRCLFFVVQLYEGFLDPKVHVIPRRDTDPEAARATASTSFPSANAMVLKHGPRVRPRTESGRSWQAQRRASCAGVRPDCEASLRRRRDCATARS